MNPFWDFSYKEGKCISRYANVGKLDELVNEKKNLIRENEEKTCIEVIGDHEEDISINDNVCLRRN